MRSERLSFDYNWLMAAWRGGERRGEKREERNGAFGGCGSYAGRGQCSYCLKIGPFRGRTIARRFARAFFNSGSWQFGSYFEEKRWPTPPRLRTRFQAGLSATPPPNVGVRSVIGADFPSPICGVLWALACWFLVVFYLSVFKRKSSVSNMK